MNLSNTARYAIRVVSYMAYSKGDIYSASSLIKKMNISDKYLKRILTTLSKNGIIQSIQGRYGGFRLSKSIEKISICDIVTAVENKEKYFGCVLGFDECSDQNPCSLHKRWAPIRDELSAFLKENTIGDIIKDPNIMKF